MKRDIFGDIVRVDDKDGFLDFIKDIKDHRMDRKKLHSGVLCTAPAKANIHINNYYS